MERITVPKLIAAGIYEAKVETGEERITKKRKTAMFELELPLRAGGVSYIDGTAQPIERGYLFLAKPGQMRQTRLPFTCAFVHIIVKDEYLYSLLSALPTFIKTERYDYFYELFERINAYYSTGLMSDEVMIVSLLLEFIYAFYKEGRQIRSAHREKQNNYPLIEKAIRYIGEHYQEELSLGNVFVNLDTANLIMYGYGNPVDAVPTLGKYIKSMHVKDGTPPTSPYKLGDEVPVGEGFVDFKRVFKELERVGFDGPIIIEREISGEKQLSDLKAAMDYLNTEIFFED
jgi:hypothetical protein